MRAPALKYLAVLLARTWLAGLGLMPIMAQATTVLELDTQDSGVPGRVTVAVQDGRIRVDQGSAGWMLYDKARHNVVLVDPKQRSYVELTRDEMRRYGQQIAAARKLLDEQLQGLLPEQRAAIEKMMGGSGRRAPLLFQSTGQKREVAGYACTGGRLVRNGKIQEEACVAEPKALGMSADEYKTVRSMYTLMHEMQELGAPGILPDLSEIEGVPIEIRNPRGDVQRLRRVHHDKLPAAHFARPEGYKRESVADALSRRG